MLRQVAVALSVLIVVILAILAAITILNVADDDPTVEDEATTETTPESRTTVSVAVGPNGEPLAVECRLPRDGDSPLLVTFENRTGATGDFRARVDIIRTDGSTVEAVAEVTDLRQGQRRSALPEPWQDPDRLAECVITAIQTDDQVLLFESN